MTGKKRMIHITLMLLAISLVLNFSAGIALGKDAEFILSADSLSLETGVSTNLVVNLVNAQRADVTEIKGLENFDVLSTSQSTSTQIINNDVTNQKEIKYIIMPKKTGQFTLQASVEYNGKTYQTNTLTVNVSEASSKTEGEASELFIKTLLGDEEIYLGQKTVLSYELFSRYNIENFGFLDSVAMDGFISTDIPEDQLQAGYVYLDDNKYVKYEARQILLSPIKAGTFTLPAYNFQVNVSTGDFFSSSKPVYLQTDPLQLTVKPLPKENQPASFSGVVGQLNLDSSYSKKDINYGDSLTLQVTASGNCNLDSLTKIFNDSVSGFSVYETQKDTEEGIENNQYHATKEFEVILVPETNGKIVIDPVRISYFNPATGTYESAEIPGISIMVHGEIPEVQTSVQNGTSAVETVKIEQVSYNTQGGEYLTIQLKKDTLFIILGLFIVLLILGAVAFLFIIRQKHQNSQLDAVYKKIKSAQDQNEIYNLFNSMIKISFNISLKASTRDAIYSRLSASGLDGAVLEIHDSMEKGKTSDISNVDLKNKIKEVYKKIKKNKHPPN